MSQRIAGKISFSVNGVRQNAKGSFSYNLGRDVRESVMGSDGFHGFMEKPQPAFIEGEISDRAGLDLAALVDTTDATVTLELGNGKVIALRDAFFAGEGTGNSEEGNIAVRFEGASAEEVA
jgi:hypothetical protein